MSRGEWYRYNKRPTEQDYHCIPMTYLRRKGIVLEGNRMQGGLQWVQKGELLSSIGYEVNMTSEYQPWLRVYYTNKRTKEPYDYKIHLTHTTPHYGGKRWWFKCPGSNCGRRVGVLYLGDLLTCRHCLGMVYASQNQDAYDRYTDRAFKLASKLGLDGNVIGGFYGHKPKGMHWKTYHRKKLEIDRLAQRGLAEVAAKFF